MLDIIVLGLCAIQFLFAIIVLGLTGHVASLASFDRDSFELFTAVWTCLVLIYLALAPKFFANVAHPAVILGINALTMLFWFAAFIAMAVAYHQLDSYDLVNDVELVDYGNLCSLAGSYCPSIEAAAIFGAFEWALFAATTAIAALGLMRGRSSHPKGPNGNFQTSTA